MKSINRLGLIVALPSVTVCAEATAATHRAEQPNVIFYLIEDTSPQFLALYNKGKGAETPNLAKLSKESIIYDNAFSNAPVSSAARTTLITGCYAPRFGGSLHRKLEELPMPEGLRMFPSYLREAGYYTLNVSKTDYNVVLDKTAWNQIRGKLGDWRNRERKDQPFFMMRSNLVTHESKLLFDEEVYRTIKTEHNPEKVYVHPSLPATDLMKYTYATFYDRIAEADKEFGKMIDMLREDGLMESTFIFFFGDNGGCVPESKGYTNDVGFRVPLLIYVPEQWREQIGLPVGKHFDGIVSFMDFGATVLKLAGIEVPEQMNGVPFLGEGAATGRESQVCYGDRFDDLYAFNRVLYRGDFRYARNYTPYHTRGLHSYYRYHSLALQQAREMYYAGELNDHQARFFEPLETEELYDLKSDPNEVHNLAKDPKYREQLEQMRRELAADVDDYCDLGFLPETIIQEEAMRNPATYGEANRDKLIWYRRLADLQLSGYSTRSYKELLNALRSDDAVARWWATTTLSSFAQELTGEELSVVEELTESYNRSFVRSRSYVTLSRCNNRKVKEQEVKDMLHRCRTLGEVLLVLNDMTYLFDSAKLPVLKITLEDTPFVDSSVEERIAYLTKERNYINRQ